MKRQICMVTAETATHKTDEVQVQRDVLGLERKGRRGKGRKGEMEGGIRSNYLPLEMQESPLCKGREKEGISNTQELEIILLELGGHWNYSKSRSSPHLHTNHEVRGLCVEASYRIRSLSRTKPCPSGSLPIKFLLSL